jgi:acetyl-CoA carboxylase biotin carboxyl carrier protein
VAKKPVKTEPKAGKSSAELGHLEAVFELMARHGVAELEWENSNTRIHAKTPAACVGSPGQYVMASAPAQQQVSLPAPGSASGAGSQGSKPASGSATNAPPSNHKQVLSPFVGTFYRSPSPTAESYVREGQVVKRGDTLCIVEAMKLMNEIEAEFGGKIVSILIENGQPVEFGEPLFVIEV